MIPVLVNGQAATAPASAAAMPLLFWLRETLNLKAAHHGCGLGQCGSCHVLVEGESLAACQLALDGLQERPVVTLEGLDGCAELVALQSAFEELQAAQCGYCLTGILVSSVALLRRRAGSLRALDRDAICRALDPHLCRCGAHNRMLAAVQLAAQRLLTAQPTGARP
jgi:aerobic-type carbon monoxide dehydrogenase small subunit (CoxS/CutS family)